MNVVESVCYLYIQQNKERKERPTFDTKGIVAILNPTHIKHTRTRTTTIRKLPLLLPVLQLQSLTLIQTKMPLNINATTAQAIHYFTEKLTSNLKLLKAKLENNNNNIEDDELSDIHNLYDQTKSTYELIIYLMERCTDDEKIGTHISTIKKDLSDVMALYTDVMGGDDKYVLNGNINDITSLCNAAHEKVNALIVALKLMNEGSDDDEMKDAASDNSGEGLIQLPESVEGDYVALKDYIDELHLVAFSELPVYVEEDISHLAIVEQLWLEIAGLVDKANMLEKELDLKQLQVVVTEKHRELYLRGVKAVNQAIPYHLRYVKSIHDLASSPIVKELSWNEDGNAIKSPMNNYNLYLWLKSIGVTAGKSFKIICDHNGFTIINERGKPTEMFHPSVLRDSPSKLQLVRLSPEFNYPSFIEGKEAYFRCATPMCDKRRSINPSMLRTQISNEERYYDYCPFHCHEDPDVIASIISEERHAAARELVAKRAKEGQQWKEYYQKREEERKKVIWSHICLCIMFVMPISLNIQHPSLTF